MRARHWCLAAIIAVFSSAAGAQGDLKPLKFEDLTPLQTHLRCEVWLTHELAEGRYPPAGSTTSVASVEEVIAYHTAEAEAQIAVGGERADIVLNAERYRSLTQLQAAERVDVGLVLATCMTTARFIINGGFDFDLWELEDE